jgi:phage terminase Nu1 subunit (DNA packaging protein)
MSSLPESVSARDLAGLWACSDRMVRQLAERGVAVRCGQGKYDLAQSNRNYVESLRKAAAGRRENEEMTPQLRLKSAQASLAELELAHRAGKLCDRDEVRDTWTSMMRLVRSWALSLPNQIMFALPVLQRPDRSVLDDLIRNGLTDLALGRAQQLCDPGGSACDACGAPLKHAAAESSQRTQRETFQ